MTYDQLVAFLAVATHGSFTAASAALHKSQPAVSKLVRNLEEEMGVELFDRNAYRASLTAHGQLLRERASAVIESTEALKSFAAALSGNVEPVVRFALDAVTPLAPVMQVLRRLQERFPAVRIELTIERLAGAAEALAGDRADVVIASMLGMPAAAIESASYARVRIVPVARHDHPLATTGARAAPDLLRSHAQIVLSDSASGEDAPSINVLEGGLRWHVSDVSAKRDVILAGMGWGGLPEHFVAGELERGELVRLDVPEFSADAIDLFVHRRRDRPRGVVTQALWEALTTATPGKPGA